LDFPFGAHGSVPTGRAVASPYHQLQRRFARWALSAKSLSLSVDHTVPPVKHPRYAAKEHT
jgi:hypothetical protein